MFASANDTCEMYSSVMPHNIPVVGRTRLTTDKRVIDVYIAIDVFLVLRLQEKGELLLT